MQCLSSSQADVLLGCCLAAECMPCQLLMSSCPAHGPLRCPLALQVFYAACQALLYVLCFRLSGLMAPEGDPAAMQALFAGPLSRVLSHW